MRRAPRKFVHVIYRRAASTRCWHGETAFSATVQYQDRAALLTYDDEHHLRHNENIL